MLLVTTASACAHAAIFTLTPWRPVEPYLTKERVTSLVHAFVSSGVAAAWIASTRLERWNAPSQLLSGVAGTADAWGAPLCAFSTGYFIQDLIAMLLYRDELWDVGSVIHHIIGILSFGSGSLTGVGNPMQIMFLFEEFSTIFMNLRKLYQGNPRLQTLYTLAFAVTFIGVRMVWGMYAYVASLRVYWAHRKDVLPTAKLEAQFLIHVAVATVSRVLNSYWSALILRRLFIVLTGRGKSGIRPKTLA